MTTFLAVAIVLSVFWLGIMYARFSELRRWHKALSSLDVGFDNNNFIDGVIWAFTMVVEKEDTRHEPETH